MQSIMTSLQLFPSSYDHLVGLEVKASASRAAVPGINSRLRWDFSGSSHTSDFKIGTPATLPDSWHYKLSAGTGLPGVSIPWLGEIVSLICNFHLSVGGSKIVWKDPSLIYTSTLLGRWAANQQANLTIYKHRSLRCLATYAYEWINGKVIQTGI